MKVKVSNLRPNPFRRMDKYPIIYDKVEKLKNSISETSFWDNILARPKPEHSQVLTTQHFVDAGVHEGWEEGETDVVGPPCDEEEDAYIYINEPGVDWPGTAYSEPILEIAYGHHRLKAIQDLGIEWVDIPVRDLDDETMIKIMANENMEDWEPDTRVINETVRVVRDFLAAAQAADFANVTSQQIKDFLGDNWPLARVREAVTSLNESLYDREAVETFSKPTHSRSFRESVAQVNREAENTGREPFIPKEEQRSVAQAVIERVEEESQQTGREPELTSDTIRREVYNYAKDKAKKSSGESRQHTQVVADAYWVQVSSDLVAIKSRANAITAPISEVSEKHKPSYRKYINDICEILRSNLDE